METEDGGLVGTVLFWLYMAVGTTAAAASVGYGTYKLVEWLAA